MIKYIGLRPGEKIHEEMISTTDAINSKEFKDYFIIYPSYTKITNTKKSQIIQVIKINIFYQSKK